jgi:serine/threonine protein kinase
MILSSRVGSAGICCVRVSEPDQLAGRLAAARPEHEDEHVTALVASRLFGRTSPPKLGRFTLLERIGRGAMGEVFAAHDPLLERKVALKLLHGAAGRGGHHDALLREARAAAALAHPNVVAIHEVGESERGIHVAMEYVEGQTLRTWLLEPRPLAQRLDVVAQAGAGLAAAHAAGVIHRDFKPENVLVGGEGASLRVRVVDFGLAARVDYGLAARFDYGLAARVDFGLAARFDADASTTLAGTLGYMAPELLTGQPADARSDQFAFGVVMWEVLCGVHPFAADRRDATLEQLRARMQSGRLVAGARPLPRALQRLATRALAPEPGLRHPSMTAIVDALRSHPARARRRRGIAATLGLVAASVLATLALLPGRDTSEPCSRALLERELDGVWDAALREQAHAALRDSPLAAPDEAWQRVAARLDDHAHAWLGAREQTCRDRSRLAALPELGLREACLARRRAELQGLTELLVRAPASSLDTLAQLEQLEPVSLCNDRGRVRRESQQRGGDREAIEALRQALARQTSWARAGHARELGPAAADAIARAEALASPLALAEALLLRSHVEEAAIDYDAAARSLDAALLEAVAARHTRLQAEIALRLVWVHGKGRRDIAAAERWVAHADAAIRAEHEPAHLRARLLDRRGMLASLVHEPARAEALHREAALLRREQLADAPAELAESESNVGRALFELGRPAAALPWLTSALEHYRDAYGPSHPDIAATLNNLAHAELALGHHDEAITLAERALALKRGLHGEQHPDLINTLLLLGDVEAARDRQVDARERYLAALALGERTLGPQHPALDPILHNLAFTAWLLGDHDAAIDAATRALAIQASAYGEQHPISALTLELLARAQLGRGELAAADATIERALALVEPAPERLGASERAALLVSAALIASARDPSDARVCMHAHAAAQLLAPAPAHSDPELAAILASPTCSAR